jgi:hypothetical protein
MARSSGTSNNAMYVCHRSTAVLFFSRLLTVSSILDKQCHVFFFVSQKRCTCLVSVHYNPLQIMATSLDRQQYWCNAAQQNGL